MDSVDRVVRINYLLNARREKVWLALTPPSLLEAWLMPNDIEPVPGRTFTFRTEAAPGFDGVVRCKVLEASEPERLAYSWEGGPIRTTVTLTLVEDARGRTQLTLLQKGFDARDQATFERLRDGWERAGESLYGVVSTLCS